MKEEDEDEEEEGEEEKGREEEAEVMRVTSRARSRRYQSLACSLLARSGFRAARRASPPYV